MTSSANTAYQSSLRPAGTNEAYSPTEMLDVELTEPLPSLSPGAEHQRVWVLGRLHSEPIGVCLFDLGRDSLTSDNLAARLWLTFREPVTERFTAAGHPEPGPLTGAGLQAVSSAWPFLRYRQVVLDAAPFISVIVCTRDRPAGLLESCLLSIAKQRYPRFEVVVVDNAPSNDAVRDLIDAGRCGMAVRYVVEPRGGLSWARNAGIAAASGEIIAFLDDDEEPDSHWLAGLACGFARGDDVGCVSGMVVPARLDTEAQELYERLGGHNKGRGFKAEVFARDGAQSPLFPLPQFGVGANMAFRREALARIGGFDVALGAGTPARAGEDTLALTLVLLAGYRIAYEPAALMRHHHRRDVDGLSRQLEGYSVGLTAYYAALVKHRPAVFLALLFLAPSAYAYLRNPKPASDPSGALQGRQSGLKRRHRLLMLTGPVAYIRSSFLQARVAASGTRRA